MARIKTLMGSGVAGVTASAIVGGSDLAITATGSSSQANSYLIGSTHSVSTVTAANTGVRLPAESAPGDLFTITNLGASTLFVYPPTGGKINGGSANAKVDVATLKGAIVWCNAANGNDYTLITA